MKASIILAILAAVPACNWTTFDDLADSTWVHSQTKPSGESAADYAIQIANATTDPTGGKLAVLSNDKPSYGTLVFDAKGATALGPNPQTLGNHFIVSLGDTSFLISDPANNKVAIVAAAIDAGNIAVVSGAPDMVSDTTFPSQAPQTATFANGSVFVIAGDSAVTSQTDIVSLATTPPTKCAANQDATTPLTAIAMASDGTTLWVWTKTGTLVGYAAAAVTAGCTTLVPTAGPVATGFMPGAGARVHLIGDAASAAEYAVLAGHGDHVTTGSVFVVNLRGTPAQVGQPLGADGIRSSAVDVLGAPGSKTYVVLGFPDRPTGTVTGGQVELHEIDPATGILDTTPAVLLNDAQPDTNELFGRGVAVMKFNGKNILVVAASSEIFAYYETLQYPDTRN